MRRHPLLTAGTVAGIAGLGWFVVMVAGGADLGPGHILLQGALLGLAVFIVALAVLWVIEAYTRPRG